MRWHKDLKIPAARHWPGGVWPVGIAPDPPAPPLPPMERGPDGEHWTISFRAEFVREQNRGKRLKAGRNTIVAYWSAECRKARDHTVRSGPARSGAGIEWVTPVMSNLTKMAECRRAMASELAEFRARGIALGDAIGFASIR